MGDRRGSAQLRWFLVHPAARGSGLGRHLIGAALAFCREAKCRSVFLWTVAGLAASAHLYHSAGFRLTEERPHSDWGPAVMEQRLELLLGEPGRA